MKKFFSIILALIGVLAIGASLRASETVDCGSVARLGIAKQQNLHAGQILQACGLALGAGAALVPQQDVYFDKIAPGIDKDAINTGTEGVDPHVTQSETQTWVQGSTIAIGFNDSKFASSCYSGLSVSTDAGASFNHTNPFCSGHGTNYGDPVLFYDVRNATWVNIDLATGCGGQGMGVWRSTNAVTWTTGPCAHNGSSDDRESGWVDNSPTSPFYGREYLTWNDFAAGQLIYAIHSDDGGLTWSAPVTVETAVFRRNVQVTTAPDGTVLLASMDEGAGGLDNRTNWLYRSADGGGTWAAIQMGAAFAPPGSSTCGYFAAMFPSYWRHMGWGDIGAGSTVSYAYAGAGASGDFGDIFYTRSLNGGLTWSAGIRLNTDSGSRIQWQPSVAVSGSNVYVTWYDARDTAGTDYERWGRQSTDGGATWGADFAISDAASPLPGQSDGTVQPCYVGDYDRGFADPSGFSGAWVDGRDGGGGRPTPTPSATPSVTPTPICTGKINPQGKCIGKGH